jgi:hypothetical protein
MLKCPYCRKRFTFPHELEGHIRVKHPEQR